MSSGEPSQGACRREPCAERSYFRSDHFRGLPLYPPSYTVIDLAKGVNHGTWDTWEEVSMCLAFVRLSFEEVEIVTDVSAMATLTGY